ncbi:MAG: glycosyltransferase [Candidatus Omnitrophota bacterium]
MAKKIKIMRIIGRLNIGGPAINAVFLTEGFNNNSFESLLVAGQVGEAEGDMSYLAQDKNIAPVIIPEIRREINFLNDIGAFFKLYRLIVKFQPDIIHTHTAKAGTIGRLAAILFNMLHKRKIAIVHTFHGHVLSGYFNKISTYFFIFVERAIANFTDIIIAVSETVRKDILSLGIGREEKIKVVHLGFELDKFLAVGPRQMSQVVNIGIVGRLVPIKNHKMFLDAAKLLLTEPRTPNPEPRFFIIGDGESRKDLEGYVQELGIAGKVKFLGWQTDLVKVYEDLDIVALTSLNEGTPVSLIEALASSRAVIATDVGGVRDIVGARVYPEIAERGILVKSGDIDSFVSGLKLLARDSDLRKRIGVSGREFVRERFDRKRLIKDMEMLYNNLLI